MKQKYETVGGQAVIEGVMMKSTERLAMAVRNENGEIEYVCKDLKQHKSVIYKIPVIRGCINFFLMMAEGIKCLNKSTAMAFSDEVDEETGGFALAISMIIGIGLSVLLFIFLPTLLASFFRKYVQSHIAINLLEGLFRVVIFISYLLLTSLLPDMKRFFMYHGAEHKTIMCSEKGLPLTVENVRTATRLHPRCGTTFMFLVMIISILIYSLIIWTDNLLLRTFFRILLLPVVAGVSYEVLRALAKTENKFFYIFKWPGLMLQKITTKEPTDDMLKVAIVAFKGAKLDKEQFGKWTKGEQGIAHKIYEKAF